MNEPRRFRWKHNASNQSWEGAGIVFSDDTAVVHFGVESVRSVHKDGLYRRKDIGVVFYGYTITKWLDEPPPLSDAEAREVAVDSLSELLAMCQRSPSYYDIGLAVANAMEKIKP